MIIRNFEKNDKKEVEKVFSLYWNDPDFLKELSCKLDNYTNQTEKCVNEKCGFFVVEKNGEIIGIAGFRNAPNYLKLLARANNPVEFYVLAVKYRNKGIGKELALKRIEEAKKLGFTEALLYSPNSHKTSWGFQDKLEFDRIGEITNPEDNEPGQVWSKVFK